MQNPIQPFLDKQGFLVLDGALATELEGLGANLNDPLWSAKILMHSPELIQQVHYNYLVSGADMLTSSSYQATFQGFFKKGLNKRSAKSLFQLSTHLARNAIAQFWSEQGSENSRLKPLVAASIGPYGAYLADGSEYRGDYGLSLNDLVDFHAERMAVLIESGVDVLLFETIPSLMEAEALIKVLEQFPNTFALLSFTGKDEKHISDGSTFEAALALANGSDQILSVGINCTAPSSIVSLIRSGKTYSSKPLLVFPNSGEQWDAKQKNWLVGTTTDNWVEQICNLHTYGVRIFGGCCRTKPQDIRQIRMRLENKL